MNDNKDKKTKKKEVIIQKPKVEEVEIEKSLEEHMEENRKNVKTKIDVKSIFTYIIMSIIVVVCLILLVHFCEKSMKELNKPTTTIKEFELVPTSEVTIGTGNYVSTSRLQTAATHTAFDANTRYTSNRKTDPPRTHIVVQHTTVSTSTSSSTTSSSTTKNTEETTNKTTEEATTPTTKKVEEETTDKIETN